MTKAELIKELQKYPDNAKVAFCIPKDYQDFCIVKVIELVDDIECERAELELADG